MSKLSIRSPQNEDEWQQYYHLRWKLLRAPWQQPEGSEKDPLENNAIHRTIITGERMIAVGRAHFIDETTAQFRYMAVETDYQQHGYGSKLLLALEQAVLSAGAKTIFLNARENAMKFYQQHGYAVIEPAETLFGSIKHYKMRKSLA